MKATIEKIDPAVIAAFLDQAIRFLFNADQERFRTTFGQDGDYLWNKFVNEKMGNEGDFICYLDFENQKKLAAAVRDYAFKEDSRLRGMS